ncbi:MAG: SUMF1/EgtB/PvdO family nonheme iron enzyme [Planctomycetes bacterium]|nr:SUMF1/EgtB/PvdO family nonheme iron enzyme [Planctomycetota bacterium]
MKSASIGKLEADPAAVSIVAEPTSDSPQDPSPWKAGAKADVARDSASDVVTRLTSRTTGFARYRVQEHVASGGMGAILKVWDEDLRRNLAMKVVLRAEGEPQNDSGSPALARFIEEAQVTGQLDHPGIVPVHEIGLDEQGRVYFTMRLVAGRDLEAIFALVREGKEGWTQTRAVGVLLKVCEAMAYAHSKKVIHRDLKPANVMVGAFGEVYVMDWGLARVLGRDDTSAVRLKREPDTSFLVHTDRHDTVRGDRSSPLKTLDGDILGTPAYMSPEQGRGALAEMGPASDVYSLGAILYFLLAEHMPYGEPGAEPDAVTVWTRLREGAPASLAERARNAPVELIAVCEKAMAREPAARYSSMLEFADDLRAYLENRVVRAYETGAYAELRKWFVRNKALATTILAASALIVLGSSTAAWVLSRKNAELADLSERRRESEQAARASEAEAQRSEKLASERAAQILRLADVTRLAQLEQSAARLWPAHPENVRTYESWLNDARALVARRELHRKTLDEFRRAGSVTPASGEAAAKWVFATPEEQWQHDTLHGLIERLDAFAKPEHGLLADVEHRLRFANVIEEESVSGKDASAAWTAAIDEASRSPLYAGLKLSPQLGLLPIGRDPHSGFSEFAHLQTGVPAVRDAKSGELEVTEDSGLVLVLLPGGAFAMGAQASDPQGANYDRDAKANEGPVAEVEVEPFFVSKYEMTQGQWLRLTGSNPSIYGPSNAFAGKQNDLRHPVEQVSWNDCNEVLARLEFALPTEAEWEYAARAGTITPWSTGEDRARLEGSANLADRAAARAGASWPSIADWPELDDGYAVHAPVGSFAPNPFGLFDMHGNVWEWCRDTYGLYGEPAADPATEASGSARLNHVSRGGSFYHSAVHARSAYRNNSTSDLRINHLGVRPMRPLRR